MDQLELTRYALINNVIHIQVGANTIVTHKHAKKQLTLIAKVTIRLEMIRNRYTKKMIHVYQ